VDVVANIQVNQKKMWEWHGRQWVNVPKIIVQFEANMDLVDDAGKLGLYDRALDSCNTSSMMKVNGSWTLRNVRDAATAYTQKHPHYKVGESDCQSFAVHVFKAISGCKHVHERNKAWARNSIIRLCKAQKVFAVPFTSRGNFFKAIVWLALDEVIMLLTIFGLAVCTFPLLVCLPDLAWCLLFLVLFGFFAVLTFQLTVFFTAGRVLDC